MAGLPFGQAGGRSFRLGNYWKLFVTERFYAVQMVIILLWPPWPQCNIDPPISCAVLLFVNIQAPALQKLVLGCVSRSVQRLLERERQKTKRGHITSEVWETRRLRWCLNLEEMGFARSARLCLGVGGLGRSGILRRGVGKRMWACDWTSECGGESGERGSASTHSPSVNKRVWARGVWESNSERFDGGRGDLQGPACSNMASSWIQHALRALWAPCTDQSQIP